MPSTTSSSTNNMNRTLYGKQGGNVRVKILQDATGAKRRNTRQNDSAGPTGQWMGGGLTSALSRYVPDAQSKTLSPKLLLINSATNPMLDTAGPPAS